MPTITPGAGRINVSGNPMTNPSPDRLDKIEALLESFITASIADRASSNERMTRLEQSTAASDERMTRVEEGLERLDQAVVSNNRFLESFSTDIKRYVDTMNNLAASIDGIIATTNQDRQETNSRLARMQTQLNAITKHLGVG